MFPHNFTRNICLIVFIRNSAFSTYIRFPGSFLTKLPFQCSRNLSGSIPETKKARVSGL